MSCGVHTHTHMHQQNYLCDCHEFCCLCSKLAKLEICVASSTAGEAWIILLQVDVFSFGVVIYELLIRQVTSAVVSQSGDATMPEMYANKVKFICKLLLPPLVHLNDELTQQSDAASLKMISCVHLLPEPVPQL